MAETKISIIGWLKLFGYIFDRMLFAIRIMFKIIVLDISDFFDKIEFKIRKGIL